MGLVLALEVRAVNQQGIFFAIAFLAAQAALSFVSHVEFAFLQLDFA